LLLLAAGCTSDASTEAAAPDANSLSAVPVRDVTAERGELHRTLSLGGVAESWRSARLAPPSQGVVRSIPVTLGQKVERGQTLAELDSDTLRLQAEAGQRAVDLAELQLSEATRAHDRAARLHAEGAIADAAFEQATLARDLGAAQAAQARASVAVVREQLSSARLVAPFDGIVTGIHLEEGEFFSAMAAMGGPPALISLDAIDPIRIDVHIPDVDLARVEAGMATGIHTDAWPDREFPGEVTLVGAAADPGARTFLVRIQAPNPEGLLKPGLFVEARLVLESRSDAVVVPDRAVTSPDSEPFVMVLDGNLARKQPVRLGLRGDAGWEVEGIEPGTQVIVEGNFGLPDGSLVRPIQ